MSNISHNCSQTEELEKNEKGLNFIFIIKGLTKTYL